MLRCIGCGKYISTKNAHMSAGNHMSHIKEQCISKLYKLVKYHHPALDFFMYNNLPALDIYAKELMPPPLTPAETRED
jgi:hypothetical protein